MSASIVVVGNIVGIPKNNLSSANTAIADSPYAPEQSWITSKLAFPLLDSSHVPADEHEKVLFHGGTPPPVRTQALPTHLGDELQASGCHG